MERVTVYRGEPTVDADGNPARGEPVPWGTLDALVAPQAATDRNTETGMPATVSYTLYVRGEQPTGVEETDLIMVRGELLPVTGKPAVWNDKTGRHVGDVITVGVTRGAQ